MLTGKSPSFAAAASVHTPNHTRQLQQQQDKSRPSLCEAAGSAHAKRSGTAANAATVAPAGFFSCGSAKAYSPYSVNTSLGNGSGSPSTTREMRTTETKKQLHDASPILCLPAIFPSKSCSNISAGAITGGALEELLAAEKSELVQILLELSSCSQEVARFIESKAQLFSMRKSTLPGGERGKSSCEGGASGVAGETSAKTAEATASAAVVVAQSSRKGVGLGIADRCCSSAEATPSRPLAFEDDSFFLNSCNKNVSAVDISLKQTSLCSTQQTSALMFTPFNKSAVERRQNIGNVIRLDADAHLTSEKRQWSSETHPCLRLYGSCRHNRNCIFASSPRNLCLNWVRNSCVAGKHCNGVHRLPDVCSQNVRKLYELSHCANRDVLTCEKLLEQHKQRAVPDVTRCSLRKCDSPATPKEQILVNPISIPASLEHYHHVLRLCDGDGDGDHYTATQGVPGNKNNDSDNNEYNKDGCNCRGCCTKSDDVDWGVESQNHELRKNPHHPLLFVPRPVPRCLNNSFAAVASVDCDKDDRSEGDDEVCWPSIMGSSLACEDAAPFLADSDDDGVGLPPCNVLTRTQSPMAL